MAKFKMKNRPKKPTDPQHVSFEVGNYVTVGYMLECIEKFKTEHPDRTPREMMVEGESCEYEGTRMFLTAPPQSQTTYAGMLQLYKVELKAYQMWQQKHKREIEKAKVVKKKETAMRKLERTKLRLEKEMTEVNHKL
ncbi:hypothetical protein LCGC14_2422990, partial [marine sediment metagenome]